MITADTLERFPQCPAYGFSVDPNILVKIIIREGGFERTDRKWAHPLRKFIGIPLGDRAQADIERILYFWLTVGGTSGDFRFKDYTDYKSCLLDETISATDQPLIEIDDTAGGYQLIKQYTFGSLTYERPIYRPRGETLVVANELGAQQSSANWTIDEATGVLQPEVGFVGTPTSWGGEFDVRCRFDGSFIPEISNWKIQRADVSICEKRERNVVLVAES